MKKCYKCSKELSKDCFYKNSKKTDGLQTYCKICSNSRRVKYYKENRNQEIEVRKKYQDSQKQKYIEFKKTLSCNICKENRWYVLDFHHKDNNKEYDVSSMSTGRYSWENILKEIKKCEVLCANCHREKHYKDKL